MHYQDDMTGFLTELKGGAAATAAAPPPPPAGPLMSAAAAAATPHASASLRNARNSLNGFAPPAFPAFSGALSSSAGAAGGPVTRTLSVLRSATGEASLGSFSNNGVAALHPMPPSLSADPPLHPHPIPQRSPPSPIPHLHHSAFANNSSYHPFATLSHLNQSPSSVARQSLNYSPQPPHPTVSTPVPANPPPQPHQQPPQSTPPPSISPTTMASQRHNTVQQPQHQSQQQPPHPHHHQQPQHIPHPASQALAQPAAQHLPSSQPQPVDAPQPLRHRPQEPHATQPQHFSEYAAPQPQAISTVYQGQPADPAAMMHPVPSHVQPPNPPPSIPMSTDALSQQEQKRASSHNPAKRARPNSDRPSQLSPTTPRSAAGAGGANGTVLYWGAQTGNSNKSRSGTTVPSNPDAGMNGHASSGPGEEQSRPERKREREKRRRETMNTRFNELAACLIISAGGKSDKESILAEAVDHVKKQAATIQELEKQNRELMSEARDLRAEKTELRQDKNYIRDDRDRLKAEVEALKAELKRKKRQKTENGIKGEDGVTDSAKRKGEEMNGVKTEVKA